MTRAVLMQCSVATEPEAIAKALAPFAATLKRAGHKAGVTVGAGNTASDAYDAAGRRVAKTVDGVTTEYLPMGKQTIAEYDGSGNLQLRYVYGAGIDQPVARIDAAGNHTYLHADGLGSVVATTDSTGTVTEKQVYTPFGVSDTHAATDIAYQFTARRYDPETGLYNLRARLYSPTLARFLQPDPIGYAAGPNLYAYVGNDPLNNTDPLGQCPWCVGAVIGFGVDFAAQAYIHYNQDKSILGSYDSGQGLAAAGAGALTAGASAFIGGAIEGGGALAIGARAVANAGLGATVTAGQTTVLNNFDNHNDSYVTSLAVGGAFGAAGSVAGDVLTSGIQSLSQSAAAGLSAGEKNFMLGLQELNNINPAPAGVATGQAVGAVVGSGASFVPLDNETIPKK